MCSSDLVNLNYGSDPDSGGDCIQFVSQYGMHFYIHHNTFDRSLYGNKFCFICRGKDFSGIIEHNTMIGNKNVLG